MIPPPAPQQDDENAADDSINKNLDHDKDRSPHNKDNVEDVSFGEY